jgi:hypothetical protein
MNYNLDTLLPTEQLYFFLILSPAFCPVCVQVYYEQPGLADMKGLAAVCSLAELLRAYVFLTEWMWTVLDPRPEVRLWGLFRCYICSAIRAAPPGQIRLRVIISLPDTLN